MINKIKLKSEFSKNVITLMFGTTIAQMIPMLISPILTRIYTPEDFGTYAVFLSVLAILSPIATLRYEQAIMLPKKSKSALELFHGTFYILGCMTVLITFFILLFNSYLPLDPILISILPLAIFILGFINVNLAFLNRKKSYKKMSHITIVTSLSNAILNIGVGLFFHSPLVLSGNIILARLLSMRFIIKSTIKLFNIKVSLQNIYIRLCEYNDMLKFSTPTVLIAALNRESIVVFLTYFFDPVLAGGYFLVQRIFGTPISMFSASYSNVFFKEFTISKTRKNLLVHTWLKLFAFTLPFAFVIYVYMYDILIFIFGTEWKFSAQIAQILLPLFAINFIFSSTSRAHVTLRMQHFSMIFTIFSFFARVIIFMYGYYTNNPLEVIKLLVFYDILQIIFMNFLAFRRIKDD